MRRVEGQRMRVSRLQVSVSGFEVSFFGLRVSRDSKVWGFEFGISTLSLAVKDSGIGIQGLMFRVQGAEKM